MATTKKSTTKAKTKAKTTAKRASKTTTAKKTTRKKAAETSAAIASSRTKNNKLLTTKLLARIHAASAAVYGALIAAVLYVMNPVEYDVTHPYLVNDPLASGDSLAPALGHLYTIDLRWVLVALLAVSGVFSLLYMTKLRAFYERNMQKKQLWTRWLELGIVLGLGFEVIALLSGWQGIVQLKFVLLLAAVIAYLGHRQERHSSDNGARSTEYTVGIVLAKVAFIGSMLLTALASFVWGLTTSPWYVYALYGFVALLFIVFNRHFTKSVNQPALVVERKYLVLSVASRALFVGIILAGFTL